MLNGRTICLRNIDVKKIFELIDKYNVTHFGGAPIVLNMITGAPESDRKKLKHKVHVLTAGAPPPSIIFKKMKELGFEVMHVYGLTETYGHVTQCAWNDDWNNFDEDKLNEIKARQGVRYPNLEGAAIMDPETMKEVPKDGKTIGEIMLMSIISPIVFPSFGTSFIVSGSIIAAPSRLGYLTPCLALISFSLSSSKLFQSSFQAHCVTCP